MVRDSREEWKTYANVFDKFTKKNIFKLKTEGHIEKLESAVTLGKEGNIFTAKKKSGERVIVKIYRLENCNFNKMYKYIRTDPRYRDLKGKRRKIIFAWTQREYRNLSIAEKNIRVPTPLTFKKNIIVMEMIGEETPAKRLKDVGLEDRKEEEREEFYRDTILQMKNLYHAGLIHADLSEFNILDHKGEPVFIDFSQATKVEDPNAEEYFERDCKNIARFFKKVGVETDKESVRKEVLGEKEEENN